jgi:hypothetical protein
MMFNLLQLSQVLVLRPLVFLFAFGILFMANSSYANAASLSLSPSTGVYAAGATFTARVVVNTSGQPVNAAEGTITFNPRELSVVSVNRTGSIFSLWVAEPAFSNSAGTISFSGGLPSGYTGQAGNIMNITFRTAGAGTAKVGFKNGSVLANDGRGTNVLTSMNGGVYTIQAQSSTPEPERIIEYVAPANTPAAPVISSDTHPDQKAWSTKKEAVLNWSLPSGVIAVRTSLDSNSTSIPTKVYDNPIKTITLTDLSEGISYFHIQLKNADGWGKVTHYRLAIDTQKPKSIDISQAEGTNLANPVQVLMVKVVDDTSKVRRFMVRVDAAEAFEYIDENGSSTISLPTLTPGYHTAFIEAFDEAGNSITDTYSFTVESFDKPVFTEYPSEINEEVIPVIKGMTRPNAKVSVFLERVGAEPTTYSVVSDESGAFIFIPEGTFTTGVYELTAQATDEFGAVSAMSESVRIAVQQPGFLRIGSLIVSVLSVLVPLIVMVVLLVLGLWYLLLYARRFRRKVGVESTEALEILHREFASLQTILRGQESLLQSSRKTQKLTKAEAAMIEVFDRALQNSQQQVQKEIEDITKLTEPNKN